MFGLAIAGLFGGLQRALELRQLAVLQLGELVVLPLALQLGALPRLELLDLFLDVRRAMHGSLLGLPDFLEVKTFASAAWRSRPRSGRNA
ncbi:MAG: hypothetical protein U1E85_08755 [Rhodocyclaceae bacterium]